MDLMKQFKKGITPKQYTDTLTKHGEAFHHIYNTFKIPESDKDKLTDISEQNLRVLIISQEFCGHCMLDVPIMFRLAEATDMPVSVFVRDENLDLMDKYLTNDKRVIPIFIFINDSGKEVAKWGPYAPEIKGFTDELKKDMPAKDDPDFDEAFQSLIQKIGSTFRNDENFWDYVYQDIVNTLTLK